MGQGRWADSYQRPEGYTVTSPSPLGFHHHLGVTDGNLPVLRASSRAHHSSK